METVLISEKRNKSFGISAEKNIVTQVLKINTLQLHAINDLYLILGGVFVFQNVLLKCLSSYHIMDSSQGLSCKSLLVSLDPLSWFVA